MTVPPPFSAPPSPGSGPDDTTETPTLPQFSAGAFWPAFLGGWALGAALTFLIRAAGQALLTHPCQGHTLLALLVPLLLGPGGVAFTGLNWRRPRRVALGLGLVAASLLPGLFVGVQDIGTLRRNGCAGGYVVFAPAGKPSVSAVTVAPGGSQEITGRIGGFTRERNPGTFTLKAEASVPGIHVTLPRKQVHAGEVFPIRISVDSGTGLNTYTVAVAAEQRAKPGGQVIGAVSSMEVNVQPLRR